MSELEAANDKAPPPTTRRLTSSIIPPIPSGPDSGGRWAMLKGSGYRGPLDQLEPDVREQVRAENLSFIEQNSVRPVEANVVYAIATL